jgi:glycosyltransferase involved in cell wall biosynthesis
MEKITFLLTGLDYAGAEAQVIELAIGFQHKGWQVQIISMTEPKAYTEELYEQGIELISLNMRKGIPDLRAIFKLKRLIQAFKPDIVHSHMIHANLLARITRLTVKMPVLICTAHNTNEGGKVRMLLYRITDPLCEITTNVSMDAVASYIEKKACPKEKIIFLPNGINLKTFKKNEPDLLTIRDELGLKDEFIWLAVGRIVDAKDYRRMVEAFSQVVKENPNCTLLIVGEGILRASVEELARSLHVDSKIKFLGIRKDIPRLMNASDAYVMSSLWEGMPMVLLEASACQLPMVATDVGGIREVLRDGISGYLARPADAEHLAEKMRIMMSISKEKRVEMGRNGRDYVFETYDIDAIIARWETMYRQFFRANFHGNKAIRGI